MTVKTSLLSFEDSSDSPPHAAEAQVKRSTMTILGNIICSLGKGSTRPALKRVSRAIREMPTSRLFHGSSTSSESFNITIRGVFAVPSNSRGTFVTSPGAITMGFSAPSEIG